MQKSHWFAAWVAVGLLIGWQSRAQTLYFNTSGTSLPLNTLESTPATAANPATLLTATGPDRNHLSRCTALAVDALNSRIFLIDGLTSSLWSAGLDGSGLSRVKSGLTGFPTDLALDVLNETVYYTTSSTVQNGNTVQSVSYGGTNASTLFTATGMVGGNGASRCTAIALDVAHGKLFLADAGAQTLWRLNLDGTGLTALAAVADAFPTGLALDTQHQQVYFTLGAAAVGANRIMRVSYAGTGLTTVFAAAGGVQRCTALDLDLSGGFIYLSDAGANALWRVPLGGGAPTSVLSGLVATAKRVRWFGGPLTRPAPGITSLALSGPNVVLNATNGFIGGTYYVLTSTNVSLALTNWLPLATNVLGASGNFSITAPNPAGPAARQQFYVLQVH